MVLTRPRCLPRVSDPVANLPDSVRSQRYVPPTFRNRPEPPKSALTTSLHPGGRTAWSSTVTVYGEQISARFWYDGKHLNNAKEDAAEAALNWMTKRSIISTPW